MYDRRQTGCSLSWLPLPLESLGIQMAPYAIVMHTIPSLICCTEISRWSAVLLQIYDGFPATYAHYFDPTAAAVKLPDFPPSIQSFKVVSETPIIGAVVSSVLTGHLLAADLQVQQCCLALQLKCGGCSQPITGACSHTAARGCRCTAQLHQAECSAPYGCAVMFLYNLYHRRVAPYVQLVLGPMVTAITLPGPEPDVVPDRLRAAYSDLKQAQIKTLSFLTYLLRGLPHLVQPHQQVEHQAGHCASMLNEAASGLLLGQACFTYPKCCLVWLLMAARLRPCRLNDGPITSLDAMPVAQAITDSLVRILKTCPDSVVLRKELLVDTRHMLTTTLRGYVSAISICGFYQLTDGHRNKDDPRSLPCMRQQS